MKRIMLLVIVGAALLLLGAGEYKKIYGEFPIPVTTDGAGDSTESAGVYRIGRVEGFCNSIMAMLILQPGSPPYAGLGNDDSAIVRLSTTFGDSLHRLDSANCASLPCTLYYASTATALDTLLKDNLEVEWYIVDSLGDTALSVNYMMRYDVTLK